MSKPSDSVQMTADELGDLASVTALVAILDSNLEGIPDELLGVPTRPFVEQWWAFRELLSEAGEKFVNAHRVKG